LNKVCIYSIGVKNGGDFILPAPHLWKNQKLKYFITEEGFFPRHAAMSLLFASSCAV